MPKDYLREFDEKFADKLVYAERFRDSMRYEPIKSFLKEAIKASKQEGREEAVVYIKENLPPDEQESCRDYKTAMMKVLEAAKEEKVVDENLVCPVCGPDLPIHNGVCMNCRDTVCVPKKKDSVVDKSV